MDTDREADLDRQDMQLLAGGQPEALDRLMNRHGLRLFHYLLRLTRHEQEAADLAQESFARVFLNRTQFKPRYRFTTWLYTIASNLARDLHRRQTRRGEIPLPLEGTNPDPPQPWPKPLEDGQANPRETLEALEKSLAVQQAVARLPQDLQLVLILAEYENQSHKEIAAILRCSPKAVEMRLYRARHLLRDWLRPCLS